MFMDYELIAKKYNRAVSLLKSLPDHSHSWKRLYKLADEYSKVLKNFELQFASFNKRCLFGNYKRDL